MEKYKRIKGSNYYISNYGNVKHLGRILRPIDNGNGYKFVNILGKIYYIHRLVAEAFIPNPDNKPCIDHIDCDKANNNLNNLRWVTYTENNNNPITKLRMKLGCIGRGAKKIIASRKGTSIMFNSLREASEKLNIDVTSISKCLNKHRKRAGGYTFVFDEK